MTDKLDHEIERLLRVAPPGAAAQFEDVADYIEQKSITYRLFSNKYERDFSSENRCKQPNTAESTGGVSVYNVPLPKNRSYFSTAEMSDLFAVYTASAAGSAPSTEQIKTFTESGDKLKSENDDYLHFIKRKWLEESWTRYSTLDERVANVISAWWQGRIRRIDKYANSFSRLLAISLAPSGDGVKLNFLKQLATYGTASGYLSSTYVNTVPLLDIASKLEEYERKRVTQTSEPSNALNNEVSQDQLALKLAEEHQVQLVTTASSLATILAINPTTFEGDWCLPFCVKELNTGECRKVIFIDKKFPPLSLTAAKRNLIFAKIAARVKYRRRVRTKKINLKRSDTSEDDEGEDKQALPKQADLVNKRVDYNLWECAHSDDLSVLSKNHRKPFKLLVKTSIKGSTLDKSQKVPVPCVIIPKLEYQPEYGAAAMSYQELTKEWVHLMLRPGSVLHRVRVDPMRVDAIMVESKSPLQLVNDCHRLHTRNVLGSISVLQTMFESLSALPVGNYLLSHYLKDNGFMNVFQEQHGDAMRSNLNLRQLYSSIDVNASVAQSLAPWAPIDTSVFTPTLRALKRIPAVFPPSHVNGKKRWLLEPAKKKKKKSKKSSNKNKLKAGLAAKGSKNPFTHEDLDMPKE